MKNEIDEMGPVDYLVVEFPGGRLSGEGLPLLVDLADRGIIRILDLVFVRKLPDGSLARIEVTDRTDGAYKHLAVFEGASSGLLDNADVGAAADVIEPGSMAGILLYENRWAAPLATALRRGGAQLVANGRIPIQAILAALDAAETKS
jgi:hypothetical protein